MSNDAWGSNFEIEVLLGYVYYHLPPKETVMSFPFRTLQLHIHI